MALRRAKDRWAQVRASMTGSRVGSMAGNMVTGTPRAGPATPDSRFSIGQVVAATGAAATGGQNTDGSLAYGQLVASNNPYDPKFMTPVGTTSVGPLIPMKAGDAAHASPKQPKTDPGKPLLP